LTSIGIVISEGQISNVINKKHLDKFEKEREEIVRVEPHLTVEPQKNRQDAERAKFFKIYDVSSQKIGVALKRIPPYLEKTKQNITFFPYLGYQLSIKKVVTPKI